jgi:DNA-directed RNA polymerase specialized sigma subunit
VTTILEDDMAVTDKLRADLEAAGAEFRAAFEARQQAAERAKRIAQRALKAGMTQAEIADLMGVDRARTIRRWLGIMDG